MTNIIITKRNDDGTESLHIFHLRSHQINYEQQSNNPQSLRNYRGELQLQFDYIPSTQHYFEDWLNNCHSLYDGNGGTYLGLKRKIKISSDDSAMDVTYFHECLISRIELQNCGRDDSGPSVINVTIHFEYYTLPNPLSTSSTTDTNIATTTWANNVVHLSGNEVISVERTFNSNIGQTYYPSMVSFYPSIFSPRSFSSLSSYQGNVTESFKNMLNKEVENLY